MPLSTSFGSNSRPTSLHTLLYLIISILSLKELQAQDQCSLYLAPTSTKKADNIVYDDDYYGDENGIDDEPIKLSMYAGVNFNPGEVIGSPELGVLVIDVDLHNRLHESDDKDPDYFNPQADFMWTATTVGAKYEIYPETEEVDENSSRSRSGNGLLVAIPGIGSVGNEFMSMVNADWHDRSVIERSPPTYPSGSPLSSLKDQSYDAKVSPHAKGAYTNYYNITLQATRYIAAGSEILADLGNALDEGDEAEANERIKAQDYDDIDSTIQKINTFFQKFRGRKGWTSKKERRVYSFLLNDVIRNAGTSTINTDERNEKVSIRKKIARLFPKNADDFEEYLDRNSGSFLQNHPELQKSIKWLEENGQCLDGLYSGPSTVQDAGKGAFARRAFAPGGLITPSPLLMIGSKSTLDMYSTKIIKQRGKTSRYAVRDKSKNNVIHSQMLTNYCFGHPESSLLLYPYGANTNFINHKSTENGANAKLVWTKQSYHQPHFLDYSLDELIHHDKALTGLGFDIVATREIKPDEEIFIDYGKDWEESWQRHVRSWKNDDLPQVQALEMNVDVDYFMTKSELQKESDSLSKAIMTACMILVEEQIENEKYDDDVYRFVVEKDWDDILRGNNMKECEILERYQVLSEDRKTNEYHYTVLSIYDETQDVIIDVPQRAIRYVDRPYTSDNHMTRAFRHSIQIPDDIFPQKWRDLK